MEGRKEKNASIFYKRCVIRSFSPFLFHLPGIDELWEGPPPVKKLSVAVFAEGVKKVVFKVASSKVDICPIYKQFFGFFSYQSFNKTKNDVFLS